MTSSDKIATEPLLEVRNIRIEFATRYGPLLAIDDVSMSIDKGEILGVVGESGAGKSLTGSAIIGLLDPPGYLAAGEIVFDGRRIDGLSRKQMRSVRGRQISMIVQDPLTSLDPLFSIGDQLCEAIRTHLKLGRQQAREKEIALLDAVGVPAAAERIDHFPHQFSGGMRQRVVIALALCADPRLIVADEPTSALDVSVQAQILNLMKKLQNDLGLTYLLISHNIAVVYHMSARVGVMYIGRIVEQADTGTLFGMPRHPYTRMLLDAVPDLAMTGKTRIPIAGEVPSPLNPPTGCTFHPRCPFANARCKAEVPDTIRAGNTLVACHGVEEGRIPE